MKALRYLLIAMVLVLATMSAQAQFAQQDNQDYQFRSTSTLVGSGSSLPNAAQSGVVVGSTFPGDNSSSNGRKPRRSIGDGDDDIPVPGDNEDPNATPVGDGVWALLLLALAYGGYMVYRRRKVALHR